MFDLAALFNQISQNPEFARIFDQLGIKAPSVEGLMKLGGPQPGGPLVGPGPMTGPSTDIGAIIKDRMNSAVNGPEDNMPPKTSPGQSNFPDYGAPPAMTGTMTPNPSPSAMPSLPSLPGGGGPAIDTSGFTPEGLAGGGGMVGGTVGSSTPTIGPWDTTVNPVSETAQAAQAQGGAMADQMKKAAEAKRQENLLRLMSTLKGIVPPNGVQPITSAGVPGGAKPPDIKSLNNIGAPALQALMTALLGGGGGGMNPLRVPQLGAIMR